MKKINKRINLLEEKLRPKFTHLIVMAGKEETKEAAMQRVMRKHKIEKIPSNCFVISITLYKKISPITAKNK
jgi:hypothetical protein